MRTAGLAALMALAAGTCLASALEDQLEGRLRGAWGVLTVEAYSGCSSVYHNNQVSGTLVSSKAARRFEPGELVKVDKINLKRSRLDLFLSLAEPVLESRIEGPFELFDRADCRVQLMVSVPREVIKARDEAEVLRTVAQVLEIHSSRQAALQSARHNQRVCQALPPDYEQTLARYEVWQAEQHNAAVVARATLAAEDAERAALRVRRDPNYLDGFGAGVEAMRSFTEDDCSDLVDARLDRWDRSPPSEHRDDDTWCAGFRDGQELLFNIQLGARLDRCLVPVPPLE
jgi:hypothetical protein